MDENMGLNKNTNNADDLGKTMNEIENLISYLQVQNNTSEPSHSNNNGKKKSAAKSATTSNNAESQKAANNSVHFRPLSDDIRESDGSLTPVKDPNKTYVPNKSAASKTVPNSSVQTRTTQNIPVDTINTQNRPIDTKNTQNRSINMGNTQNKSVSMGNTQNRSVSMGNTQNRSVNTRNTSNIPDNTGNARSNPVDTKNAKNSPVNTKAHMNRTINDEPFSNNYVDRKRAANAPIGTKNIPNAPVETESEINKTVAAKDVQKPVEPEIVSKNSDSSKEISVETVVVDKSEPNTETKQLDKKPDEVIAISETEIDGPIIINIKDALFYIIKNIHIVVLFVMLFFFCTYIVTEKFIEPEYTSNAKLIIFANEQDDTDNITSLDDMQFNIKLMSDCSQIIKSRDVLEMVIYDLDLEESYDDLYEKITVYVTDNSRIVEISVKYSDPIMTVKILGKLQEVSLQSMKDNLEVTSAKVIQYENLPNDPTSPDLKNNIVLGTGVGAVIAIIIVFYFYVEDVKEKKKHGENHQ